MRNALVLCLALAGVSACGIKDEPVWPRPAAEGDRPGGSEGDTGQQGTRR